MSGQSTRNSLLDTMQRQYLTEDLAQIERYFPGARPVVLYTPFDIMPKPRRRRVADLFQAEQDSAESYLGKLQWMN